MAQRLAGRFGTRPMAAINLTPMVPVLLALFAIIAVSAPAETPVARMDMPPGDCFGVCETPPTILVSLNRDGQVLIGKQAVSFEQAPGAVVAMARAHPGHPVTVRADADVPYAAVFGVVRSLQEAGLPPSALISEDLH